MTNVTEKVGELVELAADLSGGNFGEMMSLLALAAACVTMIPFNNATTNEASMARISNRTEAEEAEIDGALDMFVANFRDAAGTTREVPMTFSDLGSMPPVGEA
jgi:hypothetical protein